MPHPPRLGLSFLILVINVYSSSMLSVTFESISYASETVIILTVGLLKSSRSSLNMLMLFLIPLMLTLRYRLLVFFCRSFILSCWHGGK